MLTQAQKHLLTEGARILGVSLDDTHLAHFSLYLDELLRWARVTDLVSQTEPQLIVRKHFLDSLAIAPLIPMPCRLLDLGSGAGFPGLVLALLASSREVVLIEARRKRANFLKALVRRISAENVTVYEGRAETLAVETVLRNAFDVIISRATWSLKDFFRLSSPFVRDRGSLIAMKGPQGKKELHEIEPLLLTSGFQFTESFEYTLPFGQEKRQALLFAKQCST